jgi:hypothetical protein
MKNINIYPYILTAFIAACPASQKTPSSEGVSKTFQPEPVPSEPKKQEESSKQASGEQKPAEQEPAKSAAKDKLSTPPLRPEDPENVQLRTERIKAAQANKFILSHRATSLFEAQLGKIMANTYTNGENLKRFGHFCEAVKSMSGLDPVAVARVIVVPKKYQGVLAIFRSQIPSDEKQDSCRRLDEAGDLTQTAINNLRAKKTVFLTKLAEKQDAKPAYADFIFALPKLPELGLMEFMGDLTPIKPELTHSNANDLFNVFLKKASKNTQQGSFASRFLNALDEYQEESRAHRSASEAKMKADAAAKVEADSKTKADAVAQKADAHRKQQIAVQSLLDAVAHGDSEHAQIALGTICGHDSHCPVFKPALEAYLDPNEQSGTNSIRHHIRDSLLKEVSDKTSSWKAWIPSWLPGVHHSVPEGAIKAMIMKVQIRHLLHALEKGQVEPAREAARRIAKFLTKRELGYLLEEHYEMDQAARIFEGHLKTHDIVAAVEPTIEKLFHKPLSRVSSFGSVSSASSASTAESIDEEIVWIEDVEEPAETSSQR